MIEVPAYNELTVMAEDYRADNEWEVVSVLRDDRTLTHILYMASGCSCDGPGAYFNWHDFDPLDLRRRSDVERNVRSALETMRGGDGETIRMCTRTMMNDIYNDPVSKALTVRSETKIDEMLRKPDKLIIQALFANPYVKDHHRAVLELTT